MRGAEVTRGVPLSRGVPVSPPRGLRGPEGRGGSGEGPELGWARSRVWRSPGCAVGGGEAAAGPGEPWALPGSPGPGESPPRVCLGEPGAPELFSPRLIPSEMRGKASLTPWE